MNALAEAIGVYYNATGDVECFSPAAGANNESSVDADNWNWQVIHAFYCGEASTPAQIHKLEFIVASYPWLPEAGTFIPKKKRQIFF